MSCPYSERRVLKRERSSAKEIVAAERREKALLSLQGLKENALPQPSLF